MMLVNLKSGHEVKKSRMTQFELKLLKFKTDKLNYNSLCLLSVKGLLPPPYAPPPNITLLFAKRRKRSIKEAQTGL